MQHTNPNPPIKSVCTTTNAATSTNPVFIVETYKNGTEWYRKYSDGTIEQGGWGDDLVKDAMFTHNFVTAFTDADSVSMEFTFISAGHYSNARGGLAMASNTTTTFTVHCDAYINNSGGYYWRAVGK